MASVVLRTAIVMMVFMTREYRESCGWRWGRCNEREDVWHEWAGQIYISRRNLIKSLAIHPLVVWRFAQDVI